MDKPPVFKPTLPPLLIIIVDASLMIAGTGMPQWLLGAVLGAALIWLVIGAISVRGNVIRRWPKLRNWFPFLDPSGGLATEGELRANYVSGKTFRIATLAESGAIRNRNLDGCVLYGPAVLAARGYLSLDNATWVVSRGSAKRLLWSMPDDKQALEGALVCENCHFRNCTFIDIGIVDDGTFFEKNPGMIVQTDEGVKTIGEHLAGLESRDEAKGG